MKTREERLAHMRRLLGEIEGLIDAERERVIAEIADATGISVEQCRELVAVNVGVRDA